MGLDRYTLSQLPASVLVHLLEGPSSPPPVGISADDTVNVNVIPQNTFVMVFSVSISTIALAARLYTKARLIKKWDLEDTLLVLAWALIILFSAEALLGVNYGLGRHMWNVQLKMFFHAVYHINFTAIIYCVVVALIKVAILLQYIRIFIPNRDNNKALYYTCYTTIALVIISYTIITFMTIFICNPREAYWNPLIKGDCFDWQELAQATCVITVLSDFALFIIPMFPVASLHMAWKKKIMISLLFALGFIDCFAAIMRTYYTWQLTESIDVSWNIAFMAMWTWIEMSFGILVASLPVSPRFYQFIKQRLSILMTGSGKKRVSTFTESENTRATSEGASISLSSVGHAKSSETGAYYEIESPARVNFPHKM